MTNNIITVADLPDAVTGAKVDWSQSTRWLGFTPVSGDLNSREKCRATISRQIKGGYVIEYISQSLPKPNDGFSTDEQYLELKELHAELAGRFIAVHRLRPSSRPLELILGERDFNRIQDMWASDDKRFRWSVAFPIIESYEILERPKAKDVLPNDSWIRLFNHSSSTLRPFNKIEQDAIAHLSIVPRPSMNAWIAIEDEFFMAEGSEIHERTSRLIEQDLEVGAFEGMDEEKRRRVTRRACWLADRFIRKRRSEGRLVCDKCNFDPVTMAQDKPINPRSLLDVHHKHPLEEGVRYTTIMDFELLCPTCHRLEHLLMKLR